MTKVQRSPTILNEVAIGQSEREAFFMVDVMISHLYIAIHYPLNNFTRFRVSMGVTEMSGFTGSCLCGSVEFTSMADPMLAAHCHCVDCRKSSGTGHCTHVVVPKEGFSVDGALNYFDKAADSGNMVRRFFCPTCGSPVYSTNSAMADVCFPRASSLDDLGVVSPSMVVYSSRAADWDYVSPDLPAFETVPEGGPQSVIAEHS